MEFRPTIADFVLDDFIPLSSEKSNSDQIDRAPTKQNDDDAGSSEPVIEDPWRCSEPHLKGLTLTEKIHEELIRFCEFVSPTTEEHEARQNLIDRITSLISDLFPAAKVATFGSVATRLYLPISDLDIVVIFEDDVSSNRCLRQIAEELQRRDVVTFIEEILSARVPIVKFIDKITGINVDICINVMSGLESCNLVNKFQQEMPALRPLTLFLKYYLQFRQMHETYCGGMGSFLLQMMIISHLQLHPYGSLKRVGKQSHRDLNLGALLLSFFELYGKTLNYAVVGISVRHGGSYYSKAHRGFVDPSRPYLLSVENPLEPDLDVGRNSFGVMRVRRSFAWAYDRLTLDFPDESSTTLLGRLVSIRGEPFRVRLNAKSDLAPVVLQKVDQNSEQDLLFYPPEELAKKQTKKGKKSKKKEKEKAKSLKKKQKQKDRTESASTPPESHKRHGLRRSVSPKRQRPRQEL